MTAVRSSADRTARPSRSSARPLPQESAGPRLRSVGKRSRRDIGWRATVVLCVVGTFAAMAASVAIQGQRIALQEQADQIATRTAEARDHNRDLRIAVIEAESPEHVLDVARESGLVEPGPIAVVPAATGAEGAEVAGDQAGAANGAVDGGEKPSADRATPSTLAGPSGADAG